MKLLDEVIVLLSNNSSDLTGALIKTKVLLYEIGHKELTEWVNNELNGYSENSELPNYRILPAQVLANMSNMAYQVSAHPVPTMHLEKSFREKFETARMDQSISVLESFTDDGKARLSRPIPMEANCKFEEAIGNGYKIQKAWSEIQIPSVIGILTQVRSRLLDFLLELKEKVGGDLTKDELKERVSETDAENLFNNAIFGNNTTIIVGSGNSQKVNATVVKGDFASLAKTLADHGVSKVDIDQLHQAIENDAKNESQKDSQFGVSVKSWLQTMLGKAVDTSWQIEIGIAGSLLASALQRYYGLI